MSKNLFTGASLLLFALRLLHWHPEIDAPHDWRQCDTAYYILDFYQNGIDLLNPAVCWMGASDTVALEFPLPEAVVAMVWQLFGESIPLARFVFLVFFGGAVFYFYKIIDLLWGKTTAQWATLVYLSLPLSLFYSRAIHIDFFVVAATHFMFYHYLKGVQQLAWKHIMWSSLAAMLAFLIKAPYAYYFVFPMLWYAEKQQALLFVLRTGSLYLLAVLPFWLWQEHAHYLNNLSPNLDYIEHYRKLTNNAHWYFGNLEQRLLPYHWKILLQRGVFDVAGVGGMVFLLLGLRRLKTQRGLLCWILGLTVYVLVFFYLNVAHNYYQIPLLAPVAILCAWGLETTKKPMLFFVLLIVLNVFYVEKFYYKIEHTHVEIGRVIRENTPDSALVIVTYGNMDCRDPRVLFRARRRGWSVEEAALKPGVVERLQGEQGAEYWAYVGNQAPAANGLSAPKIWKLGDEVNLYLFELGAME